MVILVRTSKDPGFQAMLADIEAGKVATVIVKDMSRLGRNYLQVGMYTEMLFPQKASALSPSTMEWTAHEGMDNDFAPAAEPFQRMAGERYEQENQGSKKSKGMSGKPVTSKPVYGYVMDEDENFIIDEEAAPVVQQIYQSVPCRERSDQDSPYADRAANPNAGNAGIPQDGQHTPLSPRL